MATIFLILTNIKRDSYYKTKVEPKLEHERNQIAKTIDEMFAVQLRIRREVEKTIVDRKKRKKRKIDRRDKIKFRLKIKVKCSQIRLVSSSVNFRITAILVKNKTCFIYRNYKLLYIFIFCFDSFILHVEWLLLLMFTLNVFHSEEHFHLIIAQFSWHIFCVYERC